MTSGTDGRGPGPAAAGRAFLDLNGAMTDVYAAALAAHRERMLATTPIVLALFDGGGGRMLLHRPGRPTEAAPPVPVAYQYLKAVAHSAVAVHHMARPGDGLSADDPGAPSRFAAAHRRALAALPTLPLDAADARTAGVVLALNGDLLAGADDDGGPPAEARAEAHARACAPHLVRLIDRAAALQVAHWMTVLDGWRTSLGASWDGVYAAVNTLYVTRRKNILFTALAQFMGEDAIGERLLLLETSDFTTTPDHLLDLLARITGDRELGHAFFGHGRVMDVEILGDAAKEAIRAETRRRGMRPVLPAAAPYDSTEWPWPTDPADGTAPATLPELLTGPAPAPPHPTGLPPAQERAGTPPVGGAAGRDERVGR
ncbi:hypothetical protein [Streptomyces sp. NPDC048659]|uniref:hypothetical protein n=1 Tax=Streptomyces sp. NPDC048659 TaxID=3155489 RepID=UPI0034250B23